MKHVKTTPWNLMKHEFNQTLRVLCKTNTFQELLQDITLQKNKNSQQLGRCIGVAALFLVILTSNENQNVINISILNVSIVIKKLYLIFLSTVFLHQGVHHGMSFFAYNSFQGIIGDKLERLSNPNMIAVQHDVSGMPALILNLQYKFFRDSSARLNVLKLSLLIMLFVIIGIVLQIFSYNLIYCFENFLKNELLSFEFFLLTSCVLLLLNIPVFLVYSFTPFTLKKNERYIRWNFLQTIYRKQGIWHPRSDLWLDKKSKND